LSDVIIITYQPQHLRQQLLLAHDAKPRHAPTQIPCRTPRQANKGFEWKKRSPGNSASRNAARIVSGLASSIKGCIITHNTFTFFANYD